MCVSVRSDLSKYGPMDEWFSHRSAKPSTAVRIRFGPQNQMDNKLIYNELSIFLLFYSIVIAPYLHPAILKSSHLVGKLGSHHLFIRKDKHNHLIRK